MRERLWLAWHRRHGVAVVRIRSHRQEMVGLPGRTYRMTTHHLACPCGAERQRWPNHD